MDPISLTLAAVGTGMKVIGGIAESNAETRSARYQAEVARNNQTIAQDNASFERQAGRVEVQNQQMRNRNMMGEIVTNQASRGLEVTSGSNLDAQAGFADIAEFDIGTMRSNTDRKVKAYLNEAENFGAAEENYDNSAKYAKKAGTIRALSALTDGASSLNSKWKDRKY
jgi:hypothetical protein